jgi:hypothetical protein
MVGPDATPHRRRGFLAGRHVPVDEPLRGIGEIVVGVEGSLEHLAGDVLPTRPGTSPRGLAGTGLTKSGFRSANLTQIIRGAT